MLGIQQPKDTLVVCKHALAEIDKLAQNNDQFPEIIRKDNMVFDEYTKSLLKKLYDYDRSSPGSYFDMGEISKEIGEDKNDLVYQAVIYLEKEGLLTTNVFFGGKCEAAITGNGRVYIEKLEASHIHRIPKARVLKNVYIWVGILAGIGTLFFGMVNILSKKRTSEQMIYAPAKDSGVTQTKNTISGDNVVNGNIIKGNKIEIKSDTPRNNVTMKVIKDKINVLINESDDNINSIKEKGAEELSGVIEEKIAKVGRSGIVRYEADRKLKEVFNKIDTESSGLRKKIKTVLYEVNETEISEVKYLNDEAVKFFQFENKLDKMKKDMKSDLDERMNSLLGK